MEMLIEMYYVTPNHTESIYHEEVYKDAVSVSNHLLPKSQAYHEIWLDEEKVADVKEEKESIYGSTYLRENLKLQLLFLLIMMLILTWK